MKTVQSPGHTDRQTLSREIIDHGQKPQGCGHRGVRLPKSVTPDMMRFFGRRPDTTIRRSTTDRSRGSALKWTFQALA